MTDYGLTGNFKGLFETFVNQLAKAIEQYGIPAGYGLVIPLKEKNLLIGFQHPENIKIKNFQIIDTLDDFMKELNKSEGFKDDEGSGIPCLFKLISPNAWYVLRYAISQKGKLSSLHHLCGAQHDIEINDEYLHFSLYKFSIYGGKGSHIGVAELCSFEEKPQRYFVYRYKTEEMPIPTILEECKGPFDKFLREVYNYEQTIPFAFNNVNPSSPNMTLEEVINRKF